MTRLKEKLPEATSTGCIVGRFQVDKLHQGHIDLIQTVLDKHSKVIVFLGLSQCKCTKNNPLDFEARKQMLLDEFPDLIVLYIKDVSCDEVWSNKIDEQIGDMIGPNQTVTLYGSRDSFISHYKGRFGCQELLQEVYLSATDIRQQISNKVKSSPDFRAGVIWATHHQYPKALMTVDVAIFNEDYSMLLLAKKPHEKKYRFVGGFVEPGHTLEQTVRKEVNEETHLEVGDVKYVGSEHINDYRYAGEVDQITTSLFTCKVTYGRPTPDDDIQELKWFQVEDISLENDVMEIHHGLMEKIITLDFFSELE